MSDSIETLKAIRSSLAQYGGIKLACDIGDVINDFESLTKQLKEAKEIIAHQLGLEKNLLEFRDRLLDDIDQWRKLCDSQKIEIAALQPQWKPIEQLIYSAGDNKLYQWRCIDDPKLVVVLTHVDFINRDDQPYFTHYAPYIEPKPPEE